MPGDTAPPAVTSRVAAVAVTGLAIALGAAATAVEGLNILVSLLLAGVAYLLSHVGAGTATPAWRRRVPRLTLLLISFTVVYIVIVDFITSGNSSV